MARVWPITPPAVLENYANREVDAENSCPEARGAVVVFLAGAQGDGFEDDDQQGQAHGQLRK
jgi:hypothetical protein